MTPEVQTSWEAYSHSTRFNQSSSPNIESKRIQYKGQSRYKILIAHGKDSTGDSSDVPDMGKMEVYLQKVPAIASFMNTSRGAKVHEGDDKIQSLELMQEGSGGIGGVG
jgi:hypothetical protein